MSNLPTPYYDEDGITIYCGDCREILPHLPKVDLVLTDPPYGIVEDLGTQDRPFGVRTLQWAWDGEGSHEVIREGLAKALQLKPENAFAFCGFDTAEIARDLFRAAGMSVRPWVWVKECPPPPAPGNRWSSGFEIACFGYQPRSFFGDMNPKRRNVMTADSLRNGNSERIGHPTQKPLEVMKFLVSSLCPLAGLLVDPFMGSGTTLVAAKQLGRKAIGIEIEERYCEIAVQRLAQKVLDFGGAA
jgi:DNA modification methylase